jgi:hypothetical protein
MKNNCHTFRKAYHLASHYRKTAETDPYSQTMLARYKALCLAWSRSDKERSKAEAL